MKDIAKNSELVELCIDFADDASLQISKLVQMAFQLLDDQFHQAFSGGGSQTTRRKWCRCEADKLRLCFAYSPKWE
jgi:hypothetical protein